MNGITTQIRSVLQAHGKLNSDLSSLSDDADLYAAGLSSFATVQLMLALEDAFDVEIPEKLLNRRTFESIAAIAEAINSLAPATKSA